MPIISYRPYNSTAISVMYAYSSLPYVEYAVKAPPHRAYYSAVLIDDDCLIGVSVS